jgi:alkylated DNA repair dioxygenase AlkB
MMNLEIIDLVSKSSSSKKSKKNKKKSIIMESSDSDILPEILTPEESKKRKKSSSNKSRKNKKTMIALMASSDSDIFPEILTAEEVETKEITNTERSELEIDIPIIATLINTREPSTAEIEFYDDLFKANAKNYFDTIKSEDWDVLYEKNQYNPMIRNSRLMKWYSDNPEYTYAFSSNTLGSYTLKTGEFHEGGLKANPLPPILIELRNKVVELLRKRDPETPKFNSVLVNFYRDGKDSVAWHSDDDKWLGDNFVVPSISFGAERIFQLKVAYEKPANKDEEEIAMKKGLMQQWILKNGSLIVMKGMTQKGFHHAVPSVKGNNNTNARINITFRHVIEKYVKNQPKTEKFSSFKAKMKTRFAKELESDTSGLARVVLEKSENPHDLYIWGLILQQCKNKKLSSFNFLEEMRKRPDQKDIALIHLKSLI